MRSNFSFKIIKKSKTSWARAGILKTAHGEIETPAFAVIATQATVKSLDPEDLKQLEVQLVLANTYHLHLRPGEDVVKKAGGLHRFMNWPGPLMTDSGGFQVFSLGWGKEHKIGKIGFFPGKRNKINDSGQPKQVKVGGLGANFLSPFDGTWQFLSPEKSMKIQKDLGADMVFALDECTSPLASYEYTKKSLARTHLWALRSLEATRAIRTSQAVFGIVQGGEYRDLRLESAKFISQLPFDGIGIGGSLGKTQKDMYQILKWVAPQLPEQKPRHLLGIGRPQDLRRCVERGVDMFDCVWPTRLARRGTLLTKKGNVNIKNKGCLRKFQPIERGCRCSTCQNFTLSYLCHLYRAREILYYRLATIHNLHFTLELMRNIRKKILLNKM